MANMPRRLQAALFICFSLQLTVTSAKRPHIIHILADDFGWSEVGYHRPGDKSGDVSTPNIDELAKSGLELDRFYAHAICAPSRAAIQTGRAPIHVNVQNVLPEADNLKDTVGGYQGIPINMTGIAEVLKGVGYRTHAVGKWDVGMATEFHSPKHRGYESWLGYWHHSNDYWNFLADDSKCGLKKLPDLWRQNATDSGPAFDLANGPHCSQSNQHPAGERCVYEEALFTERVKEVIHDHDTDDPLFLFWSMHLVHMPLQVPEAYLAKFAHVDDSYRRSMHAMSNYLDDELGEVIEALKQKGMWEDTLVVFHADNGGEILADFCAGNNYPLRGGKFSNFEGGVRVNAWVNGGYLPEARRGQKEEGLSAAWDWYATYAGLAGASVHDKKAADAGLPQVDGIDLWPMIGSGLPSPRKELVIGDTSSILPNGDGNTLVGGLIRPPYKLIIGAPDKLYVVGQDVLTGPFWPNVTSHLLPVLIHGKTCGRKPQHGCLFDIFADPSESESVAEAHPEIFYEMLASIDEHQKTVYSPARGKTDAAACHTAKERYSGYWGPFLHLDDWEA